MGNRGVVLPHWFYAKLRKVTVLISKENQYFVQRFPVCAIYSLYLLRMISKPINVSYHFVITGFDFPRGPGAHAPRLFCGPLDFPVQGTTIFH